jgi:predicted naringenin-chalcone synthase
LAQAHINRIATAVPPHDVHQRFLEFAHLQLRSQPRKADLFWRMVERSGIDHRYSYLTPDGEPEGVSIDAVSFYGRETFPSTAERMRAFNRQAPELAQRAVAGLRLRAERGRISHLVVTCCTGFSAPGLDFEIIGRCALPSSVERTMIGFMGCYAAINGLKVAHHIVRSEPGARVLMVNLELCCLHLRKTDDLEEILSYLIFADGCAAALVSADPTGQAIDSFRAVTIPGTRDLITWDVGDFGFEMVLSGHVPGAILESMRACVPEILAGAAPRDILLWGVHPGGRSVLDAVERAFGLAPVALAASREVLRRYGNMSSPTVMFVLERLMRGAEAGARGCAISFGPGLTAETMLFHAVGAP